MKNFLTTLDSQGHYYIKADSLESALKIAIANAIETANYDLEYEGMRPVVNVYENKTGFSIEDGTSLVVNECGYVVMARR